MSRKQNKKNRENSAKSTYFNVDWQNSELYPEFSEWVEKVEGENQHCKCRWCNHKFFLSSMGKGALSSHAKSQKHLKTLAQKRNQASVSNIFKSSTVSTVAPGTIFLLQMCLLLILKLWIENVDS